MLRKASFAGGIFFLTNVRMRRDLMYAFSTYKSCWRKCVNESERTEFSFPHSYLMVFIG
jgi:hypothetical protein